MTGPELARVLTRRLGRDVTYQRIPLAGFTAGMNEALGTPAGDRVAELYAALDVRPDGQTVPHESWAALGVEPETITDFVKRAFVA